MDIYLVEQNSWIDLLLLAAGLLVVYFLLRFSWRLLLRADLLGRWQQIVVRILHTAMLIYEPLAILILVAQFILINPWLHGIVLGIILLGAFPQVRNYLNGRIVQFDRGIRIGQRVATNGSEGSIIATERLGLRLQSSKGIHFIDYSHLLQAGYTLLNSEKMGGFYQLEISLPETQEHPAKRWQQLQDRLATVPYFNWWHQPEWAPRQHDPLHFNARIVVHDEQHVHDFMALLREWGYQANIIKR